jgi:hypothetical protein
MDATTIGAVGAAAVAIIGAIFAGLKLLFNGRLARKDGPNGP